jgi:hypothetical protein
MEINYIKVKKRNQLKNEVHHYHHHHHHMIIRIKNIIIKNIVVVHHHHQIPLNHVYKKRKNLINIINPKNTMIEDENVKLISMFFFFFSICACLPFV